MGYIIRDGVIYGGGSSGGGDNIFHGTQAEWEQLSSAQKASYDFAAFTDDYDPSSISNPNLLDNPWFTINQRGFTSFTTDTVNKKYTVDRWFIEGATDTVITQNSDNTITIDNTNGSYNYVFRQNIEHYETLFGKTLCLSILFSDGTIGSVVIEMPSTFTENRNWNKIVKKGNVALQLTQYNLYAYYSGWVLADGIVTIKAMKLEVGSVSTLAMDTAPNYATELLKCQRYFQKCNDIYMGTLAYSQFDTSIRNFVPMRTTPILVLDNIQILSGSTWEDITDTSKYAVTVYNNENVRFAAFNVAANTLVRTSYSLSADL